MRLIGRGSFGTVYEIQRDVLGSTEKAALKVISIPQNASDIDEMYSNGYDEKSITNTFKFHLKSIVAEYSMMRKLSDCPNIVSCDDVRYIQHDDGIGYYKYDRNGNKEEIESWEDIVAVAAGCYHTIGLRSDGTVVATTPKSGEFPAACDVSDWKDIVAISAGASFSVGLRRDGTVVVAGDFCDKDKISKWKGSIRTAESWTDIIQIEAVYNQIIGLTKNGDIVACGFNTFGQCEAYDLQRECFGSR